MTLSGALSILYHAALLQKIGLDDQTLQLPLERNPVCSLEFKSSRELQLPWRRISSKECTQDAGRRTDIAGDASQLPARYVVYWRIKGAWLNRLNACTPSVSVDCSHGSFVAL
jgi:hypothetical protein